jgi:hypothetical protein
MDETTKFTHHTCHNREIAYYGTLGETISCCYIEIMVIYARLSSSVGHSLGKAPLVSHL